MNMYARGTEYHVPNRTHHDQIEWVYAGFVSRITIQRCWQLVDECRLSSPVIATQTEAKVILAWYIFYTIFLMIV